MSGASTDLVTVQGIQKKFGARSVLKGIDLRVAARRITVILGTNGAGKTTLLRILGLLETADHGTVTYDGCSDSMSAIVYDGGGAPLSTDKRYLSLRRDIMLAFQQPAVFRQRHADFLGNYIDDDSFRHGVSPNFLNLKWILHFRVLFRFQRSTTKCRFAVGEPELTR